MKATITVNPKECLSCEKADECFFGRFFNSLNASYKCKDQIDLQTVECSQCGRCVVSKFNEVKFPLFVGRSKIFCKNEKNSLQPLKTSI